MADFSFLSDDSSDEGAVEELLRQAMDLSVLEQVAAINCASFNSDSVLPTHLETRFSRLKSFPAAKHSNTPSLSNGDKSASQSFNSHFTSAKSLKPQFERKPEMDPISYDDDETLFPKEEKGSKASLGSGSGSSSARKSNSSNLKETPNGEIRSKSKSRGISEPHPLLDDDDEALFSKKDKGLKKKLESGSGSSSFKSSNSWAKKANSSVLKENPNGKVRLKSKPRSGYLSSPSDSSNSSTRSPSPPARTGCFWWSPKKVSRVKSKKNLDIGGDEAEFLNDLGIFSEKEQQKILKKAMKEEEKINREAEKIVKWAKQASARINVSDVEDELSDCDYPK